MGKQTIVINHAEHQSVVGFTPHILREIERGLVDTTQQNQSKTTLRAFLWRTKFQTHIFLKHISKHSQNEVYNHIL
eukprot:2248834-Amphidinium_carterae.3